MAVSRRLRFEILRRDNHACRYCGRSAPDVSLQIDHVNPEILGGTDDPTNLVTACVECNSGKSATPPDAALVDDVANDALRWSQAIRVAAERMLADQQARRKIHDEFRVAWEQWTFGHGKHEQAPPLPGDWTQSLDRFIVAGLPKEVLLDCIPSAMSNGLVVNENVFRYVCGIAWRLIGDLHDAARQELGTTSDEADEELEAVVLYESDAELFLSQLPMWLHEWAERFADSQAREAARSYPPPRHTQLRHVLEHVGSLLRDCEIQPTTTMADY